MDGWIGKSTGLFVTCYSPPADLDGEWGRAGSLIITRKMGLDCMWPSAVEEKLRKRHSFIPTFQIQIQSSTVKRWTD